ncbi:protein FAM53B [Molossus molossus]|uniref:protein FAM53B n=1 Tax=Molossus molossus TaxID=27622 RepID=UPI001746546E|nr:protein FAM53B [Molossus molossus]
MGPTPRADLQGAGARLEKVASEAVWAMPQSLSIAAESLCPLRPALELACFCHRGQERHGSGSGASHLELQPHYDPASARVADCRDTACVGGVGCQPRARVCEGVAAPGSGFGAETVENCETFSSLSCLSSGMEGRSPHSPFPLHVGSTRSWAALLSASGPGGRTPAGTPVPEPLPPSFDHLACREELCCEESDGCTPDEGCGRGGEPASAWRDRGAAQSSPCSLDGELDIEQIENN